MDWVIIYTKILLVVIRTTLQKLWGWGNISWGGGGGGGGGGN